MAERHDVQGDHVQGHDVPGPGVPEVSLRPMTEDEFGPWRAAIIESYAAAVGRAWGRDPDAARASARKGFEELLPDGIATENAWVLKVLDADGNAVGSLWLGPQPEQRDVLWVCYVVIDDSARGHGYGRAAMLAAEQHAREHGFAQIGLNVHGFNERARALYDSLDYQPIATQMRKPLR